MDGCRIGLVGAGSRGLSLVDDAYTIGEQRYFLCGTGRRPEFPHGVYHEHAADVPWWAEDVTNLNPELVAVHDPSEEARKRAATLARQRGDEPELYASFDAFLDSDAYDAVIVASPNHTHIEAALPLIERNVDLFCEKPVATTLENHDRLIDADGRSDSLFYVGFNLRNSPLFNRLADLLSETAIGQLGMLTCHEVRAPFSRGFRYSREDSGGVLLEKNCHDFDVFNWYADADPVRVAAFGGQHLLTENTDIGDHATVIVEYDNGVKAMLELCMYAPFAQERTRVYTARGTGGIVRTPEEPATLEVFTRHDRDEFTVGPSQFAESGGETEGHSAADLFEVRNFLRCLLGEEAPPATLLDAKKAAAVALGAERAIDERAVVEIDGNYELVE